LIRRENSAVICGIDEAGRGPLAGPVYAASVILGDDFPLNLLNDSKKMSASKRHEVRQIIMDKALYFGIACASHSEIDEINILQASLLAMKRSFEVMLEKLKPANNFFYNELKVIADGNFAPDLSGICKTAGLEASGINTEVTAMVKADAKIAEVMTASILAKTERDIYMDKMAELYPLYGYEKHKGYPTKAHRKAVLEHGPSPIQRMSFKVKL